MKKFMLALTLIILLSSFIILLSSFVLAEDTNSVSIIINKQPTGTYNLGDSVTIPLTIKSLTNVKGDVVMDLICNGKSTNFYKNGVDLLTGEEQRMDSVLVLSKEKIGYSTGTCKVKTTLGTQYILSDEFTISDILTLTIKSGEGEYAPTDEILIQGEVTKKNGALVNGFIELEIFSGNDSQNKYVETVNQGFFSINLALPHETAAGPYLISLYTYEQDSTGDTTNKGFLDYSITIKQIPTSLEVLFENIEIEPGTNLRVKAILHDQTGLNVEGTTAIITIKDKDNKILSQSEKPTDEFLEFPIKSNEPPSNWTVYAISSQMSSEAKAIIKEKIEVKYELINKTLLITNIGNVLFNDTVSIKIGEEIVNILVFLEVGEDKKFTLSAPEGDYAIQIMDSKGSQSMGSVGLTGKTIQVKEAKAFIGKIFNPFVWIFIIAICGFVAFMFFKKGYRRGFIGYIREKRESFKKKDIHPVKPYKSGSGGSANFSLSIKGDKQDSSMVCLKIKNLKEIESNKGGAMEVIREVIHVAENSKAVFYDNGEYFFFILAPVITKTFQNERAAITIAKNIQKIIASYNRLAQQKIEFGISINHGTIVAKKNGSDLDFMSLRTFIPKAKKIATLSDQDISLTEEMNERLVSVGGIKTEKKTKNGTKFYAITEMRDSEGDKKFISNFLSRLEKG